VLLLRKILYWLFHHILTALRNLKIPMMLPWKRLVGEIMPDWNEV
jgi:hypothetical protein